MEWRKEHDIFLLREMLASDIFHYRKGSPDRGRIWDEIADRLNATKDMVFHIKEKRSVRDRWNLHKNKFKKNRREEEAASGIEVDEQDEKDVLIEELTDQEETTKESIGNKEKADKVAAEDVRNKALERLGETKKRKQEVDGNDVTKKTRVRRSTEGALTFLKEKAEQELEIRKQDQKIQQQAQHQQIQQQQQIMQMVQAQNEQMQMIQQQQMQQNQSLMALLQKVITHQP
ncbi:Hypothetical predicted protein [Paramuricea clavata]|uniref:Uncharacterized protein n=1 Tax=Paramuricea clavata TaxID=317549 RepID=A0A7D9I887_PARCT|nr:Hypothetical predicted protein [Paramuricea clavata]